MGLEELERIKNFFTELGIEPYYLEHEPITSSEDAKKINGLELKQGIKAILFTDDNNNFVVVNVPGDKRVDSKKIAEALGWSKSKIRMANPEEVLSKTNCEVGAVSPFIHKEKIPIFVDFGIYENKENFCNIGLLTHSMKIESMYLKKVFEKLNAKEGNFAK